MSGSDVCEFFCHGETISFFVRKMSYEPGQVLTEKNPLFIRESRIEGNLSVVLHPSNPQVYGDGSVEVGGTLSTDYLSSATPNSYTQIQSPLHFVNVVQPPTPIPGLTQLYADSGTGHLTMGDALGRKLDLMPLQTPGDIMTVRGLNGGTTTRIAAGKPGEQLSVDHIANPDSLLRWKAASEFSPRASSLVVDEDTGAQFLQAVGPSSQLQIDGTSDVIVSFPYISRLSAAYQQSTTGSYITLSQPGMYRITCKVTLTSLIPPCTITGTLQLTDASGGYLAVPGAQLIGNTADATALTLYTENLISVNTPAGNRLRVQLSGSGAECVIPCESAVLTAELVPSIGGTCVVGAGTNQIIPPGNTYTQVPCTVSTVTTQLGGSASGGGISVVTLGPQRVYARIVLSDLGEGEMQVAVNGVAQQTMTILNGSGYILFVLTSTSPGDLVTLSARSLSNSDISINLSQTSLTLVSYGTTPFHSFSAPLTIPSGGLPVSSDSYSIVSLTQSTSRQIVSNATTYSTDDNTLSEDQGSFPFRLAKEESGEIIVTTGGTYFLSACLTTARAGAVMQFQVRDPQTHELLNVWSANAETMGGQNQSNLVVSSYLLLPPNCAVAVAVLSNLTSGQLVTRGSLLLQRVSTPVAALSGSSNFGVHYISVVNDAETITTYGTQFSSVAGLVTRIIPAGTYRFFWSLDCDVSSPSSIFYIELQVDGVAIDNMIQTPIACGTWERVTSSIVTTFSTAGNHTLQLTVRLSDVNPLVAVKTRKVRLEMIQVV